jgi:hypothetical protein
LGAITFNYGARFFFNIIRARWKRTFTEDAGTVLLFTKLLSCIGRTAVQTEILMSHKLMPAGAPPVSAV